MGGSLPEVFNGIVYSRARIPGGNDPLLTNTAVNDDHVAMSARTTITVPIFPTSGPYTPNTNSSDPDLWTIGVHSDDGFWLRVWNKVPGGGFGTGTPVNWIKSYQGGRGNATDAGGLIPITATILGTPNFIVPGPTGDSDVRGVIKLVPGSQYDIEFISFEQMGNTFWEVYAAHGDYMHDNEAQWLPVGGPIERAVYPGLIQSRRLVLTGNATAQNESPTLFVPSIAAARAAQPYSGPTSSPNTVNLYDFTGNPLHPGRPNYELDFFPIDGGLPPNVDNFYTKVTGTFRVTPDTNPGLTNQTFTFALVGDDGMQLRIFGEDFLSAFAGTTTATTATLVDESGDLALTGDGITPFNGVLGHIQLTEGQNYNFEAFHFENAGESGMAIMFAEGALTAWEPFKFFPLSTITETYVRESYLNANISLFSCDPYRNWAHTGILVKGSGQQNDISATCLSDDVYWAAHGLTFVYRITVPVTQFELIASAPEGFNGNSISIDVEASKQNANANLNLRARLFNFTTGLYDPLPGVMALGTTDTIQNFPIPAGANPTDYIDPNTGEVRLLLQSIQTSGLPNVRTRLDEVIFNFEQ